MIGRLCQAMYTVHGLVKGQAASDGRTSGLWNLNNSRTHATSRIRASNHAASDGRTSGLWNLNNSRTHGNPSSRLGAMNYAEDRLDRRSRRTSAQGAHDDLAVDLQRADDTFKRHRGTVVTPTVSAELRGAHELSAKALRDGGANAEATFHFGMAWKFATQGEDEWAAAGDYAQMCELAGYPEIGALALLFKHAGGCLADAESDLQADPSIACYIAFPPLDSVIDEVLDSFQLFSDQIQTMGILSEASDVLGQLALMSRKGQKGDTGEQLKCMGHFIVRKDQSPVEVPCALQFWKSDGNSSREMPPVIQLLLLKLLFSSPFGGPFLELACLSMAFLPLHFLTAGSVGRRMARDYKSHWAYYVFIRYLVLGEKIVSVLDYACLSSRNDPAALSCCHAALTPLLSRVQY